MKRGVSAGMRTTLGWGLKGMSADELERIHGATLEVLQGTGVAVAGDEAQEILAAGGCWVNKHDGVVKFPPHVVQDAIAGCPQRVLLAARDPAKDFILGGKEVGFTTFGTGVLVVDPQSGAVRDSTLEDVAQAALLSDALDEIDILTSPIAATDKPPSSYDLHMAAVSFANCAKHYHSDAEDGARARKIIEMAGTIVGGVERLRERPIVSFAVCPSSPLQLARVSGEVIIEAARHWVPINVLSMAMAGATSPVSLSGALVTHNAEVLAGVVLAQLTNRGAPVIYGSSTTAFDLYRATSPVGTPEMALISAAVAQMANCYGLPSYVAGG